MSTSDPNNLEHCDQAKCLDLSNSHSVEVAPGMARCEGNYHDMDYGCGIGPELLEGRQVPYSCMYPPTMPVSFTDTLTGRFQSRLALILC